MLNDKTNMTNPKAQLTQAEIAALDSGITSSLVELIPSSMNSKGWLSDFDFIPEQGGTYFYNPETAHHPSVYNGSQAMVITNNGWGLVAYFKGQKGTQNVTDWFVQMIFPHSNHNMIWFRHYINGAWMGWKLIPGSGEGSQQGTYYSIKGQESRALFAYYPCYVTVSMDHEQGTSVSDQSGVSIQISYDGTTFTDIARASNIGRYPSFHGVSAYIPRGCWYKVFAWGTNGHHTALVCSVV